MSARLHSPRVKSSPAPPRASHTRLSDSYRLPQLPSSLPSYRPLLFRSRRSSLPTTRRPAGALPMKLRVHGSWLPGYAQRIGLSMQTNRKTVEASEQGALGAMHVHFHILGCSASQGARHLSGAIAYLLDAEMSGSGFLVGLFLAVPLQTKYLCAYSKLRRCCDSKNSPSGE